MEVRKSIADIPNVVYAYSSQWSLTLEVRKSSRRKKREEVNTTVAMEPDLGGQEKQQQSTRTPTTPHPVAMEPDLGGQEKTPHPHHLRSSPTSRNGA